MNIEIANRLVNLRKNNNLSQEALADKLGISRQAVSKWERAEASPDTDNLILLARLYGVSLDELLKTEDEIPQPEPGSSNLIESSNVEEQQSTGNSIPMKEWQDRDRGFRPARPVGIFTPVITLSIVIVYLLIGCFFEAWHPGWLLFLLIPIWRTLEEALISHNANKFAYPVLAALIYLILGLFFGLWHPGWVIFVTVPLYYTIINMIHTEDKRYQDNSFMEDKNNERQ